MATEAWLMSRSGRKHAQRDEVAVRHGAGIVQVVRPNALPQTTFSGEDDDRTCSSYLPIHCLHGADDSPARTAT